MRSSLLARSRALLACICLATVTGAASCSTATSSVSVKGSTLTIYASVPPAGAGGQQTQDVLDAERLALQQAGDTVGKFTVKLVAVEHPELSANARAAIEDSSAIAYLGDLQPGSSAASIGITNAEDLLQVSPTDNAVELTQTTAAVPKSPTLYYESLSTYGRTFARVVPTTALEAKAVIEEMQALGVKTLYATSDGSAYGKSIALAVRSGASPAITVESSDAGADAIFYGGSSPTAAARVLDQAAASNPHVKLFVPSALDADSFLASLSPAAQRDLYASSPGFLPSDLTPQGRTFISDFRTAYGHAPTTEAIFGYEAMSAVLAVLKKAGSGAGDRSTVVSDFLKIKNRSSALGTYSIDSNGDIKGIAPFVFSRAQAGTLVPFKAVQAQG